MKERTRHEHWTNEIAAGALLLFYMMLSGTLCAQTDRTLTIRMLDCKTGQPITTSEFQVWFGESLASAQIGRSPDSWVRPDKDGVGQMIFPPSAFVFTVHAQYGPAMWGYVNCDRLKYRGPFREHWYSISEALTTGIAAPNFCSRKKITVKPDEFVFFVRPMTFWEKMHE